jgi:hypothetical protein
VFPTLCLALAGAARRRPERFRILHFSVQFDHVHLVVEASDKRALSSGIRSVSIRIARYVNDLVRRAGRFWADRWHGRELTSPRQVRNVLVYVFGNFRKHAKRALRRGVDAFSSAARFDGWRGFRAGADPPLVGAKSHVALGAEVVVAAPKTWLAKKGWRRLGLVGIDEAPRRVETHGLPGVTV